jgi:hypothetical protein
MKDRDGFNITLEALPLQTLNDQGQLECRITAWEPHKDDQQANSENNRASSPDYGSASEVELGGGKIIEGHGRYGTF